MYGYDVDSQRSAQAKLHGVHSLGEEEVEKVEHGCAPLHDGYDVVIECSGVAPARVMSILATKRWGQSFLSRKYVSSLTLFRSLRLHWYDHISI